MEEEEEYFNQRVPVIHEDPKKHKAQNKQVLLNLGVFALLTALSSLVFMGWLAKKSRTQLNILPFHNPLDRTQLLCPLNTSFDTTRFSCVACSDNCEHCYHEYEQRCVQCVHPFKLQQNECIVDCVSVDGVCVNESEPNLYNYSVIDLGTELRVNQLFQVEIHNYSQENIYIIFPPLGQSFNYFYSSVNLFQLAEQLDATILVFSTPYTEVLQIQAVDEDDPLKEEYRYVERVFQFVNSSLTQQVKSINIVALGEMLFFAHELSTLIVRNSIEIDTAVYLIQNSEIQLSEVLNLSYIKLQHILAYVDQGWDISHKENKTNLVADNVDDLTQLLQDFLRKMNFNSLIKPSFNMKIPVFVLSEKGCRDISNLYEDGFNAKEFKQIFLDSGNLQYLFTKLIVLNRSS